MIIGIGGISNAGKSKLADRIAKYFNTKSTIILCQDNFANPTKEILKINGHTNWEIPDSINFNKFYNKIVESAKTFDIVIAEGLFVYVANSIDGTISVISTESNTVVDTVTVGTKPWELTALVTP